MRDVGCHIGVIIVDYRRVDINELRAFETNLLGGGDVFVLWGYIGLSNVRMPDRINRC